MRLMSRLIMNLTSGTMMIKKAIQRFAIKQRIRYTAARMEEISQHIEYLRNDLEMNLLRAQQLRGELYLIDHPAIISRGYSRGM